jgi:hypothetical protein
VAKGPGFETSSLISFGIDPGQTAAPWRRRARLVRRIHDEIRIADHTVSRSCAQELLKAEAGITDDNSGRRPNHHRSRGSFERGQSGFFATLGARIVAGRDFDERDMRLKGEGGQP